MCAHSLAAGTGRAHAGGAGTGRILQGTRRRRHHGVPVPHCQWHPASHCTVTRTSIPVELGVHYQHCGTNLKFKFLVLFLLK